MARLFPYQKPEYGLSLNRHSVCLLKQAHAWPRPYPVLDRSHDHVLPSGVLHPTYQNGNVLDSAELVKELLGIRDTSQSATIALTLPNLCAQIEIFECDSFPKRHLEQEAFLQWRFQESSPVPLGDQTIVFQPLPSNHVLPRGQHKGSSFQRILAASIRTDILLEYEEVCERAGLIPIKVGLSAIELYNFLQTSFRWDQEYFFACFEKDSFVVFAFHSGTLSFFRMKNLRNDPSTVALEVMRTLQIYENAHPHSDREHHPLRVPFYFLSNVDIDWERAPSTRSSSHELPLLFPTEHKLWEVQPISCIDKLFPNNATPLTQKDYSLLTLSTWAGLQ